ncbi:DUF4199 domain-containing protein [Faecalibacter rhinopitheci]|uniref:DUF4199 domain-containing protein n=1 Tax=Faecalibacter rhinopitheci TaxID=2779678 RepID=A0A8J7FVY0_9FLAO|nr:DUF4199 domain-containing protein [Faecalibacter rhinopitheci]MBF0597446.1 DUF4199 domain-containing protein [Faecalibacter rhinopitheci]MBQ0147135.1 DUF4199 domain-containing protein [Candidatus Onthonaster equi]
MNTINKVLRSAFTLAGITLVLFFGLYIVYSTNGSITQKDYYVYTMMICCFGLIPLFAGFCFFTMLNVSKAKAKVSKSYEDLMTFKEGFKIGFYVMFIAGFISLAVIFIFFNTTGILAQDALRNGILDTFMSNMDAEQAAVIEQSRKEPEIMKVNLFSFKYFFGCLSMFLSFYMAVSAMFAQFLKKRVY